MRLSFRKSYTHTIYASYLGYITQAIVNNFAPLLFLTFQKELHLGLEQITLITTINFAVQLLVDAIAAKVVDRIGYRPCIVAAHVFASAGLLGLALLPQILPPLTGILIAVVLYAIGGGIIEVLISPIVEACPTERKAAAMSLLHSFYCWGHVFLVLASTGFFALFGVGSWRVLACLWALVPLANVFYFLWVPLAPVVQEGTKQLSFGELFRSKVFWVLMVMMVCAGASEQAMSQWASAFAEKGLNIAKAVGIFWPGTFSTAAAALPGGGTAMFALMALAGDLGCSGGPTVVGMVSGAAGGALQSGLLAALIFPATMLLFTCLVRQERR